jgi:hypothetical protein
MIRAILGIIFTLVAASEPKILTMYVSIADPRFNLVFLNIILAYFLIKLSKCSYVVHVISISLTTVFFSIAILGLFSSAKWNLPPVSNTVANALLVPTIFLFLAIHVFLIFLLLNNYSRRVMFKKGKARPAETAEVAG